MGKKLKTGKQRKDKFYRYAKEAGYRSRAAFKLLQLNKKYNFLQTSRVLIDLCAAPGGWLQVAAKTMPIDSLILGIDLVPIKPIRNVRTEALDITSSQCETWVKRQLQTWKADCVLHDGAPNLGSGWEHDAFMQARLTLSAFRVATKFLREGGWFVTKLFRSRDFFKLIWVFEQFFEHVHQTKPQASRLESAELFIVCEHYRAPLRFDPAFLDADRVFADEKITKGISKRPTGDGDDDEQPEAQIDNEGIGLNLLHPEKTKRRAEGYPEGCGPLVYRTVTASEFIQSDNFEELLSGAVSINLDDETIENCKATTDEIRACIQDIRVLNKRDLKNIIAWRAGVRKELAAAKKKDKAEAEAAKPTSTEESDEKAEPAMTEADEREIVLRQIRELEQQEQHASKKKLKKLRERRAKLQRRIDTKMIVTNDRIDQVDDVSLFSINRLAGKNTDAADDASNERSKLLRDCDRLDAEMERVANELAKEAIEQFEEDEESKFERQCETREEARRRKNVSFEKPDPSKPRTNGNQLLDQYDDPVDRRPLEIEADQQTDFINKRISRFEKQLVALRKLSAHRAAVTKKARKHGVNLDDLGKASLDNVAELDVEQDEARINKRIARLEKMVTDLREHELSRRLPPDAIKRSNKKNQMDVDEKDEEDADEGEQFAEADQASDSEDEEMLRRATGEDVGTDDDDDWRMDQEYVSKLASEKSTSKKAKKKAKKARVEPEIDEAERSFSDDDDDDVVEKTKLPKSATDAQDAVRGNRKVRILTPEELAVGEQLATSLKRRRNIIEDSFNRYAFNDSEMDLPRWFADDEMRNNRKALPVTTEQVNFYRERLRGINSRPIKKVIEAKARRKRRIARLLKKASQKTEAILNADGDELVASTEKSKQIQRLYRRARHIADKSRERAYVVQRRGQKSGGQHVARPKNVKGRFRLVDRRLKKDRRSSGKADAKGKKGGRAAPRGKKPMRKGKAGR